MKKNIALIAVIALVCGAVGYGYVYMKNTDFSIAKFYDNLKVTNNKAEDKRDDGHGEKVKDDPTAFLFEVETTTWEKCPEMPFKEMLEKGMPSVVNPDDPNVDVQITASKNWDDSKELTTGEDLTRGFRTVTYEVVAKSGSVTMEIHFFMEFDRETGVLVAKGGRAASGRNFVEVGIDDALDTLNIIMEAAKK